ncbi:hypothetical protein NE237_002804 [Protea cynaroides]|uniref:Uncharacterized protein n=1 Tax=Protea cynaroides TaxID=273540 RepID=A0A9Q0QS02_9MAGN|nr:hypothetical protein NE237_002804 [Protea cynaroides]
MRGRENKLITREEFGAMAASMTSLTWLLQAFQYQAPEEAPLRNNIPPRPPLHLEGKEPVPIVVKEDLKGQVAALHEQMSKVLKQTVEVEEKDYSVDNPLLDIIMRTTLKIGFSLPMLPSYEGTTDLEQYLRSFKSLMLLHRYKDAIICSAFPSTLKNTAQL